MKLQVAMLHGGRGVSEAAIGKKLIEHGQRLFNARKKRIVEFTDNPDANALLNDLRDHPHAFVLACIMDRQDKATRVWLIPHKISEQIGGFSIELLAHLSAQKIKRLMSHPRPLHRFADIMAGHLHSGIQRIVRQYDGDASRIWKDKPSSAEVVYRFLEFDGVGPKIATMAANILAREFKVPLADYVSIDVSADVHVRRVFGRLGLCPDDATIEQVIYKARALHPDFPGVVDLPCWDIGRKWCSPGGKPKCDLCYMSDICPAAVESI